MAWSGLWMATTSLSQAYRHQSRNRAGPHTGGKQFRNMTSPKLLCIDWDGVCRFNSRIPESPFYRILNPHQSILKPNVPLAFDILLTLEIPFYIVTKQRALGDGTLTPENFHEMWKQFVRDVVPFKYRHIEKPIPNPYVETKLTDKREQFKLVIARHPELKPEEIWVLDDSITEVMAARALGLSAHETTDLYRTVCGLYSLQP
jgi:hypothetical protein